MPFLNTPAIALVDPTEDLWELREPLSYQAEEGEVYTVPAGYRSAELASVPQLPFIYLFFERADTHLPGILHDWLCSEANEGRFHRPTADALFYEALRSQGIGFFRAKLMWAAVRGYTALTWRG